MDEILYRCDFNSKNIGKKIASIVSQFLTILVIALLLTILVIKFLLGYNFFVVRGWSSEPVIPYNSLIIVRKVAPEKIEVGDYITWNNGNSGLTHVVITADAENDFFETVSNDPNASVTEKGGYEKIIGKVQIILPTMGKLVQFVSTNVISVMLAIILGYLSFNYFNFKQNDYSIMVV